MHPAGQPRKAPADGAAGSCQDAAKGAQRARAGAGIGKAAVRGMVPDAGAGAPAHREAGGTEEWMWRGMLQAPPLAMRLVGSREAMGVTEPRAG
eukprot:236529-Chlamydomonas_euryale.AAC.1